MIQNTLRKTTFLLLFLLFSTQYSFSQQVRPASSSEIYHKLQQLNVLGTVMYVAAHPDDENTRLLSYLVHHDHIRTVYLSLTRGDGGQNILGDEQGALLGLIRTHELMAARKIDGAEQVFTRVIDFGYTKSPDETFEFWNKNDVLKDVQAAFDYYRPDVVITRFPTTGEGGHGQHTASAIAAEEVFNSTTGWKPIRLLFNAFRFGDRNTTSEDQFKMYINQYDPLLGEGYGEMAGRSRSIHRSQGAGTPQTIGETKEYFKWLAGKPIKSSIYDDIDLTWNRINEAGIGKEIEKIIAAFNFKNPSNSLPVLIKLRGRISSVKDEFWRNQKLKELDGIILSCAGVMAELIYDKPYVIADETINMKLSVISRSLEAVSIEKIKLPDGNIDNEILNLDLKNDSLLTLPIKVHIPTNAQATEPYWLVNDTEHDAYQYDNKKYKGAPDAQNELSIDILLKINNVTISLPVTLSYKVLNPIKGDIVQQLFVVPPVSVEPMSDLFIFEKGKSKTALIKVKAFKNIDNAVLVAQQGSKRLANISFTNLDNGKDTIITLNIPTQNIETAFDKENNIEYFVEYKSQKYTRYRGLINYDHLPQLQYFTKAISKPIAQDWKVNIQKVGYISGAGDKVMHVLNDCGLKVEEVPEGFYNNENLLKSYDAIIIGVRAFNTNEKIASLMPILLKYVQNGGNLIVQYNTSRGLKTNEIGPYPIKLSGNRVTDETAKVTFTDPSSVILNIPNKITQTDFDNWVQERGVYFAETWDSHYKTMLSMHDVGENDLQSAILYAPYGKGNFIYTSLVFFRQLPAGNVGAIRLMMNMLSVGR